MNYLFNSGGQHVANLVNGQLHAPTGQNVGHYLIDKKIFISMSGRYMGEIVNDNRLLYRVNSPYKSINFGSYGNYGNVGNYGNPGNHGNIGTLGGFREIDADWL